MHTSVLLTVKERLGFFFSQSLIVNHWRWGRRHGWNVAKSVFLVSDWRRRGRSLNLTLQVMCVCVCVCVRARARTHTRACTYVGTWVGVCDGIAWVCLCVSMGMCVNVFVLEEGGYLPGPESGLSFAFLSLILRNELSKENTYAD